MQEIIISYGYFGMFLMGMLAATIVPLGSEWLLAVLLLKGLDPYLLVISASAGNYLGAVTNYLLGILGGKYINIREKTWKRAQTFYEKFGAYSLLFSWLPVIGDPLCIISGILRYNFAKFSLLVVAGKTLRYGFLTYIIIHAI